ncbi:uncharacterized protein LOC143240585 [Tachypleus tridentatus]|uniref:uncharacterized protein LOC143240585 n=1 Tax=Tachypleus tridentatus TaxID=6853 RepID=UPI003FD08C97
MQTFHWLIASSLILGIVSLTPVFTASNPCNEETEFTCRSNSTICIPLILLRNGEPDCPDRSDEECLPGEFQCLTDILCIPESQVHDGWKDCFDGSDEECGENQFRCRCGFPRCLDRHHVGDGISDCLDGSDEG